jgi:hypothetical protein
MASRHSKITIEDAGAGATDQEEKTRTVHLCTTALPNAGITNHGTIGARESVALALVDFWR